MVIKTDHLLITECHLLLPIIWEGDLNIHSNSPLMKQSRFGDVIMHGDTVFSLATGLVEKQESRYTYIYEFETSYKRSVTIGDEIFVEYKITRTDVNNLHFSVYKNGSELVMDGSLQFSYGNEVLKI
ncbi:MaoC/PaaZ C-terminal domain-containing protein [Psychrobacillus sp. FSL K6-2836]|uniref:MaoC/PaaZ C-terminal domain-containing protein n=1 Tax=Psychrobacillus sp. FSL K6-2836 TaxID=2921548 RepID=UPI0030F7413C